MILQGISVMANVLSVSIAQPNQMAPVSSMNIIFPFIFLIIFGVTLWFLSDKLSTRMVKGDALRNESQGVKASDVQRIAFSVLGLFFVGNSLPKLVSTLTSIYSMSELPNFTARLLVGAGGAITQFIVGLGIFLGSQGLVNFLNTIRTAGSKREDDYDDKE